MVKIEKCDKCGTWINEQGNCYCGHWSEDYRKVPFHVTLEKALLAYDHHCEQNNSEAPMSGDHWSGNCYVLFKGDYELCMKVREFIKEESKK